MKVLLVIGGGEFSLVDINMVCSAPSLVPYHFQGSSGRGAQGRGNYCSELHQAVSCGKQQKDFCPEPSAASLQSAIDGATLIHFPLDSLPTKQEVNSQAIRLPPTTIHFFYTVPTGNVECTPITFHTSYKEEEK